MFANTTVSTNVMNGVMFRRLSAAFVAAVILLHWGHRRGPRTSLAKNFVLPPKR